MPTITATEFKARCLELMNRVQERGEVYVITKRNRQVAKLAPIDPPRRATGVLGCLRGEIEIVDDLTGTTPHEPSWGEALREWDELNAGSIGKPRRRAPRGR
jgi:prevent-host-death family protein